MSVTIVVSVPAIVVSLVGIVVSTTATVVSAGVDDLLQAARPIVTVEIANAIAITFFMVFLLIGGLLQLHLNYHKKRTIETPEP